MKNKTFQLSPAHLIILGFIVAAIIGVAFLVNNSYKTVGDPANPSPSNVSTENITLGVPNSNTKAFVADLLYALDNYHFASLAVDLDESSSDILLDSMTNLKNKNNKILTGDRYLEKYGNSDNEIIKLAVQGTLGGSKKLVDSNNKLYNYLKYQNSDNPDVVGIRDAIATYLSEQKDGYSLIAIAAPQVGYLIFAPAERQPPKGKIPYLISSNDRKDLINEIDRTFGGYLYKVEANGDKNSVIFAVENIRGYLVPDTYEEASK